MKTRRRCSRKKRYNKIKKIRTRTRRTRGGDSKNRKTKPSYNEDCSICLENFNDTTKPPIILNCGHKFHNNCLFGWCNDKQICTCPNCKQNINEKDRFKNIINEKLKNYVSEPIEILENTLLQNLPSFVKKTHPILIKFKKEQDPDKTELYRYQLIEFINDKPISSRIKSSIINTSKKILNMDYNNKYYKISALTDGTIDLKEIYTL
jgi:hypothetical protein